MKKNTNETIGIAEKLFTMAPKEPQLLHACEQVFNNNGLKKKAVKISRIRKKIILEIKSKLKSKFSEYSGDQFGARKYGKHLQDDLSLSLNINDPAELIRKSINLYETGETQIGKIVLYLAQQLHSKNFDTTVMIECNQVCCGLDEFPTSEKTKTTIKMLLADFQNLAVYTDWVKGQYAGWLQLNGFYDEAIELFLEMLDPNDNQSYYSAARCYYAMRDMLNCKVMRDMLEKINPEAAKSFDEWYPTEFMVDLPGIENIELPN